MSSVSKNPTNISLSPKKNNNNKGLFTSNTRGEEGLL